MTAHEAFIRRAAQINAPFMLKGSYVTRQYFQNPFDRLAVDLDYLYMDHLDDPETANKVFSDWVIAITEMEMKDEVTFRSFRENAFWRSIDYAMADDFPTVNTDLLCTVDGKEIEIELDISFNLPLEQPPIPMTYKTLDGSFFFIPHTPPLSLQVSWKIHQTLVRPRFKDLFDLMYLVQHESFDEAERDKSFQALLSECKADKLDLYKIRVFLSYDIASLFTQHPIKVGWEYWQYEKKHYGDGASIGSSELPETNSDLPKDLVSFLLHFREAMEVNGFDMSLAEGLPEAPILPEKKEERPDEKSNDTPTSKGFWRFLTDLFD